jgi:hypothetical protein
MNIPAFWMPVAPLYALSGLGALAVALWAGSPTVPLTVSAACAVSGVVWTLIYFRPTIGRFLEAGGGNTPAKRLQSAWVLFEHDCQDADIKRLVTADPAYSELVTRVPTDYRLAREARSVCCKRVGASRN